ncbi:methylated-DNA--[protein]-cysteine S-methyltransferase [Vibrio sp. WXL103]|uniref:methylated-DNA--[protein]-cysteine S-methyltransferase n=1 Tax=unclassified Vibrio TaxID=2614977 RepID=UPI003EC928DF
MNYFTVFTSPLGKITAQANQTQLLGVWFEIHTTKPESLGERNDNHPVLLAAKQQITEFFSGRRTQFDLPLKTQGTDFQQSVWRALQDIPFGETWSYKQLAEHIGKPKAVRAVGAANGKNPISVIIPCHRVVANDGRLSGYAGGVERKRALLDLESSIQPTN